MVTSIIQKIKENGFAYLLKIASRSETDRIPTPVDVKSVGRKIVTLKSGQRFEPQDPNAQYLVEKTIYSPEYLLFATRHDALNYVNKKALIKSVRQLSSSVRLDYADIETLRKIETALLEIKPRYESR